MADNHKYYIFLFFERLLGEKEELHQKLFINTSSISMEVD